GVYTLQRSFPEVRNIPLWKNAAGRFNAVYDLMGNGKTAIKASIAKYYDVIGTGTPGALNPNGTINQNFVWIDRNSDLQFQPGELGAASALTLPLSHDQLQATRGVINLLWRYEKMISMIRDL